MVEKHYIHFIWLFLYNFCLLLFFVRFKLLWWPLLALFYQNNWVPPIMGAGPYEVIRKRMPTRAPILSACQHTSRGPYATWQGPSTQKDNTSLRQASWCSSPVTQCYCQRLPGYPRTTSTCQTAMGAEEPPCTFQSQNPVPLLYTPTIVCVWDKIFGYIKMDRHLTLSHSAIFSMNLSQSRLWL